jgi:hypothetical protein
MNQVKSHDKVIEPAITLLDIALKMQPKMFAYDFGRPIVLPGLGNNQARSQSIIFFNTSSEAAHKIL